VFLELASPGHKYKIALSGDPGRVWKPYIAHVIRASVQRKGVRVIESQRIHFADWMDDSWDEDYVGHDWVFENVLRFQARYPTPGQPHRTSDVLTVKNAGGQAVSFLRVSTTADLVLIFDLAPGTTTSVNTTGRTDVNWFHVDGRWLDGTEIPSAAPNFHDLARAGSDVVIVIERAAVAVTRRERASTTPPNPTASPGAASEKLN
jgi:hypothetical protein